jgi:hypothetical protein
MANFNPGEVAIQNLTILSPRSSSWNMAPNFLSGSIVESIFTPGVVAELEIIDYVDYISQIDLKGDEQVSFQFQKPNGGSGNFMFHLNSIRDVENYNSMHGKKYKLMCVSREALSGQANHVQKGYNTQISNIVKDIFGQLGSNLNMEIEETKGNRNFKIPNQPLFSAIETLRKEAISMKNLSSNFLFFITQSGIHFKTIEGMLTNGDVKSFQLTTTAGTSILNSLENNILAWKVVQNFDAMNRIVSGATTQRVATFNSHTNEFIRGDYKPNQSEFTNLGGDLLITEAFKAIFPNANRTILRYINPNQNLKIDKSNFPDNIAYKMTNLAQMQEQMLRLTVIGDPILEAGKTITCNIPQVTAASNPSSQDAQVSGRWLISKLEHNIQLATEKPRYTCNLECLKGAYQGA